MHTWNDFLKLTDELSDINLYHEEYGSGEETLIFIHGFGVSLYTWRRLVRPLSEQFKVILIDLKGFGKSPKPEDKHYSVYLQASLLVQFIKRQDIKKMTIVGHSYGGGISLIASLYFMNRDRERLKRLILLDSVAYEQVLPPFVHILRIPLVGRASVLIPARVQVLSMMKEAYLDEKQITKEAVSAYSKPLDEPGGRHAIIETARQMIPADLDKLSRRYGEIDIPVLIVWGLEDSIIPLQFGERLNNDLPDSRLEIIKNCGHAPQEEKPKETIRIFIDFLNSH
ncbi:MAG: alpha/beta hydrolase [Proteobacteria bacterium]|nr:alpha/beta hydrolase [Pseudomonadota bacterium]